MLLSIIVLLNSTSSHKDKLSAWIAKRIDTKNDGLSVVFVWVLCWMGSFSHRNTMGNRQGGNAFDKRPSHIYRLLSIMDWIRSKSSRKRFEMGTYFFLGFDGNQPLATRFSCSKSSNIDQKQLKPTTPNIAEMTPWDNSDAAQKPRPATANSHQHPLPQ